MKTNKRKNIQCFFAWIMKDELINKKNKPVQYANKISREIPAWEFTLLNTGGLQFVLRTHKKDFCRKKTMVIVFLFRWKAVPFWHTQMHVQSFNKDLFLISYSRQWAIFFVVYLKTSTWCFSLPTSAVNLSYSMLALHCKTVIYLYGTKVWNLTTE